MLCNKFGGIIVGICGYVSKNKIKNNEVIVSMVETLTGQKANNLDVYIHSNVAMSCNTPSLFSTEYNKQKYTIVFNGKLFNLKELECNIAKKGFSLREKTDAEIVLACYILFGEDALNMFDGAFSFAILNEHKKEIILARDSLGLKPLYYYQNNR